MNEDPSTSFASFSITQSADGQRELIVKTRFAFGDLVEFDNQVDTVGRGEIVAINLYDDGLCSFQIDNREGLYCDDEIVFYEIYGDQMLLLMNTHQKQETFAVPDAPLPEEAGDALDQLLTNVKSSPVMPTPRPPGEEFFEYRFKVPYCFGDIVHSDAEPYGESRVYAITYSEEEDLKYGVQTEFAMFIERPVSTFTLVRRAAGWTPGPIRRNYEPSESTEAFNEIRKGGDGELEESSKKVIEKLSRFKKLETAMLLLKYSLVATLYILYLIFCVVDIADFLANSNKYIIIALEDDEQAIFLVLFLIFAPLISAPIARRMTRSMEGGQAILIRGVLFFGLAIAIIVLAWALLTGMGYTTVSIRGDTPI